MERRAHKEMNDPAEPSTFQGAKAQVPMKMAKS